ncbi:MAG TPA: ATP-grasp domain-containing protein [Thermoleophilaceae bacterium]|nr:ATP-grasp domain-containing protein [Thermoleophilaceae bacterium]
MTLEGASVLVVGAGYSGKRRVFERLAGLGVRAVVVDEPDHWSESLVADGLADTWISASVTGDADADAASVLAALRHDRIRVDGVATYWEDSVSVAARVAAALGLPGNSPQSVDAARSKVRMREVSAELGLPTPMAQRVRSLDELYAAAAQIGFPAVVKPEFGASAMGCVRVDSFESLPHVYRLVRDVVRPETDGIFRAGNDLLLEEYLDGVEFDVDLVMNDGACLFSSVSQNWPTAEPSLQETGLHCPPTHSRRAVRGLVDLSIQTARAFGLARGVLHIEGKCTSGGPRIVEVNTRMGGGRIHQIVEAVWGVDLIEAQLRSSLDLPSTLAPSRRPRCAVVNAIVHAPATGRLEALPLGASADGAHLVAVDVQADIGQEVAGPDRTFATPLAEVTIGAKNLRSARALCDDILREPPVVATPAATPR